MEAVTDTVGGVERITYGEGGAPELTWALDTTTLIGGFGVEDPDYQFGRLMPRWLASDQAGNLYVFDSDAIRILGYDTGGSLIGEWGREGRGPGEIGGRFGVGAIDIGPGDTLWIADRPNQRFTLIPVGASGRDPTSMPVTNTDQPMSVAQLHVDSRGALAQVRSTGRGMEAEMMPPQVIVRFVRYPGVADSGPPDDAANAAVAAPGAAEPDTLWIAPSRAVQITETTSGGNRFILRAPLYFDARLQWAVFSDGGLAVNDTAAYEIHLLDASGETRRILRRDPAPRATTEADRQAMIDRILARQGDAEDEDPSAAERRRERAENLEFAEVIPRISSLRVDPKDRIWVGVSESAPGEVERIDVYERDGTLVGELRDMPMPDFFFGDDGAVILGRDELDVQQIRILRLVEEPEELETVAGG